MVRPQMLECWPSVLPCLFAEALAGALREAWSDLEVVLGGLGVDGALLAYAGWTVAAALYLRVRLERLRRRSLPFPAPGADGPPVAPGSPDRHPG